MIKWQKVPKPKKGMWFVRVRGSYLPATPQGWLMQFLLAFVGIQILITAFDDGRSIWLAGATLVLELIGLGAIFTYIASKKT